MEADTSQECQPATAGALLSRIYAGNTGEVCTLCLCENARLTPGMDIYLKDDYTDVNFSLEQLVKELQFDKITDLTLLTNICETCAQQLSLFYLFKRKCIKLASGLSVFYKLAQRTADQSTVLLPFETIGEFAATVKEETPPKVPSGEKSVPLLAVSGAGEPAGASCIAQNGNTQRDTVGLSLYRDPIVYLAESELSEYVKRVVEFVAHRKSFCGCCLRDLDELFDTSDGTMRPVGENEISLDEMLSANNFGSMYGFAPALICQECLDVIISAYNFKTTFEKSKLVIRSCVAGLDTCLDSSKYTGRKKKTQLLNLYSYLKELIPIRQTAFPRAISASATNTERRRLNREKKVEAKSANKIAKKKFKCKLCGATEGSLLKAKIHKLEHCFPVSKTSAADGTVEPSVELLTACHLCGKEFSTLSKLQLHISTMHHDQLLCPFCNKALRSKLLLKNHMNRCKRIDRPFECDICHLKHTRSHMARAHRLRHFPKTIKCEFCNVMLWSLRDLNLHQSRLHRDLLNKTYECSICHMGFPRMTAMRAHISTHPPGSRHKCKYCGATYRSRVGFHGHSCPGKIMSIEARSNNVDRDKNKKTDNESDTSTLCAVSGLVLKTAGNVGSRNNTSQTAREVKTKSSMCDSCGNLFKNSKTLSRHQQTCKTRVKKEKQCVAFKVVKRGSTGRTYKVYYKKYLECSHCSYTTLSKLSLELHLNKRHFKVRPYQCAVCEKAFHTKPALQNHEKTHLDIIDDSLQCKQCGKLFKYKKTLMYHTRLHTGEQPYPCDLCDEKFINASRRQSHRVKKHFEPALQCQICSKLFYFEHDLNYHIRKSHSGEPKKPGASKRKLQKIKTV